MAVVLLATTPLLAQTGNSQSNPIAKVEVGAKYVGWDSSYVITAPFNGSEYLVPLTVSATPWSGGKIFAQTEFAQGSYTDSATSVGTETLNLTGLSDTVLGLSTDFKSFSIPSMLNVALNVPTGDPTWETKQTNSIIPTEFIDSDYRGRGWGLSLLYGLSLQAGGAQYGVAAGYMYSGAFNPSYGLQQLKLGDSVFFSLNRASDRGAGQMDMIRFSAFYFLNTQVNGSDLMQMGPNLNLSYAWQNPKGLSFEAGGQYFFPANLQQPSGQLTQEPYNSLGPRLYLSVGYPLGDLTLNGRLKYVFANGYPQSNVALYVGGGWLAGLEPSYRLKLDKSSALKFSVSYDYIYLSGGSVDLAGNREDLAYWRWTFGTFYEVNL